MVLSFSRETLTTVEITHSDCDECLVVVSDNGVGLPEGFNLENSSNLGLQIVPNVTENELKGSIKLTRVGDATQAALRSPDNWKGITAMAGTHIKFSAGWKSGAGYIALPESGVGPAVIVIQEWWGLVGHITDIVDRFAGAGFVALAPDLYHGQAASEPDRAKKLMMELELDRAGEEMRPPRKSIPPP
jgi:hypothetical protein